METKNIFKAINEVMKELEPIAKGRKNEQQGYMFRGVDDVMNALSPLLTKHGIFPSIVDTQDVCKDEVVSAKGTKGYHYVRRYTIRFYATDGSFVDVKSDGEAIDYGDKASNKAASVAYREAMFKTFVIPFENDDIENADHELKPQPAKPVQAKPAQLPPLVCSGCGKNALLSFRKDPNVGVSYCPDWKDHKDRGDRITMIEKEKYEKNKEFFETAGDGADVRIGEE